jgi:hypothetical protein
MANVRLLMENGRNRREKEWYFEISAKQSEK